MAEYGNTALPRHCLGEGNKGSPGLLQTLGKGSFSQLPSNKLILIFCP